jgi:ankyrin repeat protein
LTEKHANELWIRGGPGCGKSTLTKHLVETLEDHFSDERSTIIIHYFFHSSQNHFGHATTRLLVSLLQQVSNKLADAQLSKLQHRRQRPYVEWPDAFRTLRESLRRDLSRQLQSRSQIFLIVDGLDECNSDEVADVLDLCKSLGEHSRVSSLKLLFSSRSWFVTHGQEHVTLDLDFENRRSASIFLWHEVANFASIQKRWHDLKYVINEIPDKAISNFLWLSFTLSLLNFGSKRDTKPSEQLISLPPTFEQTSKTLLERLTQQYDDVLKSIPHAAQILSWCALAVRPLSSLELETALSWTQQNSLPGPPASSTGIHPSLNGEKLYLIAQSLSELTGGMVRIISAPKHWRVRLIHDAAKDFLLQPRMRELHVPLADISRGRSMIHLEMARTCLHYVRDSVSRFQMSVESPSAALDEFPFLEYATSSWAVHAKAANSDSISDEEFLHYFPWPTDPEMRLVGRASSILLPPGWRSEETSYSFLHCAAYCGLDKPIRAFLRLYRREEATVSDLDKRTIFGRTALHIAASMGHWTIVESLLNSGADVNVKDSVYGNSVLHWATLSPAGDGRARTLESLVQAYANVNDKSNGTAPLALAAAYGDIDMVTGLLNAGADPDAMDYHRGLTALSLAIIHRHVAAVSRLLEANACLEYGDTRSGMTLLEIAIVTRQQEVVWMLLKKGAKVNSLPLRFASAGQAANEDPERMWLNRMLILFRDLAGSGVVECPAGSCKSQRTRPSQPQEKSQCSSPSNKRRRTTEDRPDGNDEDQGDNGDPGKRRKHSEKGPLDEVGDNIPFCCPYYARNSAKFSQCAKRRWGPGNLHHILEHLEEVHFIVLCARCKTTFPNGEQLNSHQQQEVSCPLNEVRNYEDGYDQQQDRELRNRKGTRGRGERKLGSDEYWHRMCAILFPGQHEPSEVPNISRALDADRPMQQFERFVRQKYRDSPTLRKQFRETIGTAADDAMLDKLLGFVSDLPGSLSERWRREQKSESRNQLCKINAPGSEEVEEGAASSPEEQHECVPRPRIVQLNSESLLYNTQHDPRLQVQFASDPGPSTWTSYGHRPSTAPLSGPMHSRGPRPQQTFHTPYHVSASQPHPHAMPMPSWQVQRPYNTSRQQLGSDVGTLPGPLNPPPALNEYHGQLASPIPMPISDFGTTSALGQPTVGGYLPGFDLWPAMMNQHTSLRSSYPQSYMPSHPERNHTSATSQSQAAAFESPNQDALLKDMSGGPYELELIPSGSYSLILSSSVSQGDDGNQDVEEEETGP